MEKEELKSLVSKRITEYQESRKSFLMTFALAIFESNDYDNPLKLEALKFLAHVDEHF